ncbi:glycosyl transferase family 2 [Desulfobulbus propionicus DSM 2032]|uniref:Glycosyl transferase family 2 n=1 Tax=Desulfobulbus propionicus (strain ATCC 33891 / DSM 2032 / VKM B-1956 / 1pr3) TaxID=577650 RepID=A0A7U3YKW3_DESPD|nr:glycosyl transferase family 2 [Desulfobulbus propionicus DSM 2032]
MDRFATRRTAVDNLLISVIIPTYNRAWCLERAIGSVLAQQRACTELIVVDDGSTDDTAALVARLASDAPIPIRLLVQDNRGAAAARNLGISQARGALLAFLDADDWWLPRKLALQAAAMEAAPETLVSHTREIWFRHGQRVNQKKKHDPPHGDIFAASLGMCVVGMSTVMVRRQLFDRYGLFDATLPCCEDYDLWLRVGCREAFFLVPESLTGKDGGRPDQLSVIHRMGMDRYRIRSLDTLIASGVLTPAQHRAAVAELARKCTIYGQGCIKHGRPEEGRRYLELADRYHSAKGHHS